MTEDVEDVGDAGLQMIQPSDIPEEVARRLPEGVTPNCVQAWIDRGFTKEESIRRCSATGYPLPAIQTRHNPGKKRDEDKEETEQEEHMGYSALEELEQKNPEEYHARMIGESATFRLAGTVISKIPESAKSFLDPFAAGCTIPLMLKKKGMDVIMNDRMYYSYTIANGVVLEDSPHEDVDLDDVKPVEGYFYKTYPTALTDEIRQFADGLAVKYKDDCFVLASLGRALTSLTYRASATDFIKEAREMSLDDFKTLLQKQFIYNNQFRFKGGKAKAFHDDSFKIWNESLKADVVYIRLPGLFSRHGSKSLYAPFAKIDSILQQKHIEEPIDWSRESYEEFFRKSMKMACRNSPFVIFSFAEEAWPGFDTVREWLADYFDDIDEEKVVNPKGSSDCVYSMESKKAKLATEIVPFSAFQPLRPKQLYIELKETLKSVTEQHFPIAVERKLDGARVQLHKKGEKIQLFLTAEQVVDITASVSEIVEEAKNLPDTVLDGIIIGLNIKRKYHLSREQTSRALKDRKGEDDDIGYTFHVFDALWYQDHDMHVEFYNKRREVLSKLSFSEHIKLEPVHLVSDMQRLSSMISEVANDQLSDGAMIKFWDLPYLLTGETRGWIKYKKLAKVPLIVIDIRGSESSKIYDVGCMFDDKVVIRPSATAVVNNKKVVFVGTTVPTKATLKPGQFVECGISRLLIERSESGMSFNAFNIYLLQSASEAVSASRLIAVVPRKVYLQEKPSMLLSPIPRPVQEENPLITEFVELKSQIAEGTRRGFDVVFATNSQLAFPTTIVKPGEVPPSPYDFTEAVMKLAETREIATELSDIPALAVAVCAKEKNPIKKGTPKELYASSRLQQFFGVCEEEGFPYAIFEWFHGLIQQDQSIDWYDYPDYDQDMAAKRLRDDVKKHGVKHIIYYARKWHEQTGVTEIMQAAPCRVTVVYNLEDLRAEIYKYKQELSELAPVLPSGERLGEEINLRQILQYVKPFEIYKPHIYIVGGLATRGKTTGDIDIFIRSMKNDPANIPLMFRISRMFPPELRDRLQFLFEDTTLETHVPGPYTNYVPLYSLRASIIEPFSVIEMQARAVRPLKFLRPIKPIIGYKIGEVFGLEALKEIWKKTDFPAVVQKKYDGAHVQLHKSGDRVRVYSDSGIVITHRVPTFVEEVKKRGWPQQMILDIEVEGWRQGRHQSREVTSGFLREKADAEKGEDSHLVFNVFDIMYINGRDLHRQPYSKRLQLLSRLPFPQGTNQRPKTGKFNRTPSMTVHNRAALIREVRKVSELPGSEGAVIKSKRMMYPLTGSVPGFVKYKETTIYRVAAIKQIKTRTLGVFNYEMGVPVTRVFPGVEQDIRTVHGRKYLYVGKTMNTTENVGLETTLRVSAENIFVYDDNKRLRLYIPVVVEAKKTDSPDKPQTIIKIARDEGQLVEKQLSGQVQMQAYPPTEKPFPFVLQVHYRGKSAHHDFRVKTGNALEGWTIFSQPEGEIVEEPDTLNEARALTGKVKWKWPLTETKAQVRKKAPQPPAWLKVQGVFKPGTVGATKGKTGVIQIIDQGTVELGTRKPWFFEYFVRGTKGVLEGRIIFRLVVRQEEQQDQDARTVGFWLSWVPEDQEPYVISNLARKDEWVPPFGISALPTEWRKKVPSDMKYWKQSSKSKRLEVRDELIDFFKKKLRMVERLGDNRYLFSCTCGEECSNYPDSCMYVGETALDFVDTIEIGQLDKLFPATTLATKQFVLIHHYWKGPTVVRAGPSIEHWDLFYDDKQVVLEENPIEEASSAVFRKPYTRDFKKQGQRGPEFIKPGQPGNPTKDTPAWVAWVDTGTVEFFEDTDHFKRMKFNGKKLKGIYAMKREPNSSLWRFEKAAQPGENLTEKLAEEALTLAKDEELSTVRILFAIEGIEEEGDDIYVSGTGLSWGVWNGIYFPPEVIKERPERAIDSPVAFGTHGSRKKVGEVKDYKVLNGTTFVRTRIRDPDLVYRQRVRDKDVVGFSWELTLAIDKTRRVARRIISYDRLVLVPDPACKVCIIGGPN